MRKTVAITAGDLRAEIVPSLGGGIARFDILRDGKREPIFRPWPDEGTDDPNRLASYVLAPWSNRFSGGGFSFGGVFHPLQANFPPEPFPLHGNGWTCPWNVTEATASRALLELRSEGPAPFRYLARLTYELLPGELTMRLSVTNKAELALPFGLGFHPWLPRTPDTRLKAAAKAVWLESEKHLPTRKVEVHERPEWDFSTFRRLPDGWINNGFVGWDGQARIEWPSRGLSLAIEASERLEVYLLYSPDRDAPFFCFEPVSHVVDAHNLPGGPAANGLTILAPDESVHVGCRFGVETR
jgi:aldose 1-epimerase